MSGLGFASDKTKDGKCPKCNTAIPGVWSQEQALAIVQEFPRDSV